MKESRDIVIAVCILIAALFFIDGCLAVVKQNNSGYGVRITTQEK